MKFSHKTTLKLLLWFGAAFFAVEFLLHIVGLPILEHDKIFIPTHDRYIAIYSLTTAVFLVLVSTNVKKYKLLLLITLFSIFIAMINGFVISRSGGYAALFPVKTLDNEISYIGYVALIWMCIALWLLSRIGRKEEGQWSGSME